MNFIDYMVKVFSNGSRKWRLNGELHREDGPAIELVSGNKYWYLYGKRLTEEEFNKRMKPDGCEGKVVEIDGKRYQLVEVSK